MMEVFHPFNFVLGVNLSRQDKLNIRIHTSIIHGLHLVWVGFVDEITILIRAYIYVTI